MLTLSTHCNKVRSPLDLWLFVCLLMPPIFIFSIKRDTIKYEYYSLQVVRSWNLWISDLHDVVCCLFYINEPQKVEMLCLGVYSTFSIRMVWPPYCRLSTPDLMYAHSVLNDFVQKLQSLEMSIKYILYFIGSPSLEFEIQSAVA